jgi:hypothetical protein
METKPRDAWDKLSIVLHPVGGLFTALAVAVVGVMGSRVIDRRQSVDTNARLYSELMSRREEAESTLRKDMCVSIIQNFLQPNAQDLDGKVLNLELLAYNFHDSLNLKPLFMDMQMRLGASNDPRKRDYLARINRVAREVAARQLFSLEGHGKAFRRSVDLDELKAAGRAGLPLDGESITVDSRHCQVDLRVLGFDEALQQFQLRLEVKAPEGSDQPDTRVTFNVGFFDFPMIDNTRLANGLRCAVTLAALSESNADLVTVCFPSEYAGLKDRPYYDEVIHKLQEASIDDSDPLAVTSR